RVGVGFVRAGRRKKATLDGVEPARLSHALGTFPAVVFSPQDVALVSAAPSMRRRFLDVVLALTSPVYLAALQHYRASLARRNAALRDGFAQDGGSRARRAATAGDAAAGGSPGRPGSPSEAGRRRGGSV